jgi:hypothetical protein
VSEEQSVEWLQQIEREVERALRQAPVDFAALLYALPSIDPLVVVRILRSCADAGNAGAATLLASASRGPRVLPVSPRPIAHPLEYDWRFTAGTAEEIVNLLGGSTRENATIGYLGAPAAFVLAGSTLRGRQHVLLDRSTRWQAPSSGRARIITIDLLHGSLPDIQLDAAVVDPPWYREYHEAFLWAAAALLRPHGLVLASFPPHAVRPGITEERAEILRNASQFGLYLESIEPLRLGYATPPFERAAFAAAGVLAVPDWRRGDMLRLRRTDGSLAERPAPPNEAHEWVFTEVDAIPIATRHRKMPSPAVMPMLLEPAVPGATLPTVSRRDVARAGADLWSSRNRIYKSPAPALLQAVVRSLAGDGDVVLAAEQVLGRALTRAEEETVDLTTIQVRDLIRLEREEHGLG